MDTTTLARAARQIAGVIGEYHPAGRRMTALIMTPDKYLADGTRRQTPTPSSRSARQACPGLPAGRGFCRTRRCIRATDEGESRAVSDEGLMRREIPDGRGFVTLARPLFYVTVDLPGRSRREPGAHTTGGL